jgi:hypothetical protein
MSAIQACALPSDALLARYNGGGAYTDCYAVDVRRPVSLSQFIEAFYTGRLFRLERLLLAWFVSRPSTDEEVRELASGALNHFSAWTVESRSSEQLLMCDLHGRTRSWFKVESRGAANSAETRLYFGSAVVPVVDRVSGQAKLGFLFSALLGFHKLYSRLLLGAARSGLIHRR